jgi:hypothetical protein
MQFEIEFYIIKLWYRAIIKNDTTNKVRKAVIYGHIIEEKNE